MRRSRPAFFTVASPCRSGTKWYSTLLTTERSHCFHELTSILDRYPTSLATVDTLEQRLDDHDAAQLGRRLVLDAFPEYFSRLSEVAEQGLAAGNSDAGATPILTGLWSLWPEMRFLFSFRDGICEVNAMAGEPIDRVVLALDESHHPSEELFERCCQKWAGSVRALEGHRDELRARGAAVLETRFERLVAEPDELAPVWNWVLGEYGAAAEGVLAPIRAAAEAALRDAGVSRSAEEIWASWSGERRASFRALCGETQGRLGYPVATARGGA